MDTDRNSHSTFIISNNKTYVLKEKTTSNSIMVIDKNENSY